jgi:hypothetical protein
MPKTMGELKRTVFFGMLELADRVFIVVQHSENVVIGNRGFTEDEMKKGLVLVFNSRMQFSWDDSGVSTTLVFGTTPQKCFIPIDDVMVIYSPELNAQFMAGPLQLPKGEDSRKEDTGKAQKAFKVSEGSKVVKVDFKKKKS